MSTPRNSVTICNVTPLRRVGLLNIFSYVFTYMQIYVLITHVNTYIYLPWHAGRGQMTKSVLSIQPCGSQESNLNLQA